LRFLRNRRRHRPKEVVMRHLIAVALAFGTVLTTSVSLAETHFDKSKRRTDILDRKEPALIASADALPAHLASPAAGAAHVEAPPAKDAPVDAARVPPTATAPGIIFGFGSGGSYLGGAVAEEVGISALFVDVDVHVGAYVSRHVGFTVGIHVGYGALFDGCAAECSTAYRYQVPVMAQYAMDDRRRGVFFEGGLAFVPTYFGRTKDAPTGESELLHVSSPFDLKLGIGYRLPSGPAPQAGSLEARLGVDVGRFASVEYSSGAGSVRGDIVDDALAMHFAFGFSGVYTFAL
jgi:hypothetical protein